MIVLAAKRAANTGRQVKVITSVDKSDDGLCETLEAYEIPYYRGSLNNVLARFKEALCEASDETRVLRLTADNVLPDGNFLDEIEDHFTSSSADIMHCVPNISNLPYGLSAEITTVRCIREAHDNATISSDLEHVTPFIYRNKHSEVFVPKKKIGYSNLRVTIDTFDDYVSVRELFTGIENPVQASVQSLISNFPKMKYRPHYLPPKKPMTLGSAQLGLDYGITNVNGKVDLKEAIELIKHAITEGIEYIDTAAAYGDSERVIGRALRGGWEDRVKIITKLLPFDDVREDQEKKDVWKILVRNSILTSCLNLNSKTIDTVMLHRANQQSNRFIIDELLALKDKGIIKNIGISVQNPKELEIALKSDYISIIQMPFNVLDYRWDSHISSIRKAKSKRELKIHARSVLLQGLLCSNDHYTWKNLGIDNGPEIIRWLDKKIKQYEKTSVAALCIGYVNSQDWVDSVVLGVDTKENLLINLMEVSKPFMGDDFLADIKESRPIISENSLDPSKWRKYV